MTARILIVDDVFANIRLLEARLTAEYFSVVTAMSGPQALDICERGECDVVLLDVMMPGMDGFEVCRRLKADPVTAHIPVIMVTALGDPEDRVQGLSAGADGAPNSPVIRRSPRRWWGPCPAQSGRPRCSARRRRRPVRRPGRRRRPGSAAAQGWFRHGEWILENGRTYVISGTSDITRILQFDKLRIPGIKNAQKVLDSGNILPTEMNIFELHKYIENLKASHSLSNDILVRYYQKISQPLACLVVALAGAPLGLLGRRSRSNMGLIYSAIIVFLYYVLQSSSGALGEAGRIDPLMAAWMPNIVLGSLGLFILYFKAK